MGPIAVDVVELGARLGIAGRGRLHRLAPRLEPVVVARQQAGVGLADEADAERVDEAVERDPAARLDRPLAGSRPSSRPSRGSSRELRQALRVRGQAEDVGGLPDQPRLEQLRHLLAAEPLDVERVAADEVAQPLGDLGRADQAAGAAPHRLALGPQREAAADRAVVGEPVGLGARRAAARAAPRPPAG